MKRFNALVITLLLLLFGAANAQTSNPALEAILDLINKDRIRNTVRDMESFETRLCNKSIGQNRKVAQYLVDRLHEYGVVNAHIDSFHVAGEHFIAGKYDQYMYNVLGTLKGTGATDSTVIIGAHLDAISYSGTSPNYILTQKTPGADDNATGCAVMIEMARVIHENKLKPRHNIDFMAYDAEEVGKLGSIYDAEKRKTANENIIVMLNNDMVANQSSDPNWRVRLYRYSNSSDVAEKAKQAVINFTTMAPIVDPNNASGSDSYSYFYNGYKTLFTQEFDFSPYYHSVNDLTQNLNFEYCRQIARMNFVLLADYSAIDFSTIAVPESKRHDHHIEVFPNPATDIVHIRNYNDVIINKIDIYDISGRLLESLHSIMQQQNIVTIDHLSCGVYFVKIHTDKGVVNKKFIKL